MATREQIDQANAKARELLKAAGFAVTVAEAPQEIKALCDLVVGPCMDGAVADLIEYLEERYDR